MALPSPRGVFLKAGLSAAPSQVLPSVWLPVHDVPLADIGTHL